MRRGSEKTVTERSVNNLQTLITVVVSLALIQALKSIITGSTNPMSIDVEREYVFTTFVVFISTLIPFHHGANRYLDETYIVKDSAGRPLTGLVDFFFFFVEAGIFYVMALSITEPDFFFIIFAALLGVDVLWLIFVYSNAYESFKKVEYWLWLNLAMVIIVILFYAGRFMEDGFYKWLVLAIFALIRTGLDYKLEWPFYWPSYDTSTPTPQS